MVYGQQQRWPTWGWEEPRVDQCADTDTWWVDDVMMMIFSDQCVEDVVMVMVVVIIPVTMMTISMHRS